MTLGGDQIEVLKIFNGYENIDRNMFFSLKKDSRTRGHEVDLVKNQCRLDVRKYLVKLKRVISANHISNNAYFWHGPCRHLLLARTL